VGGNLEINNEGTVKPSQVRKKKGSGRGRRRGEKNPKRVKTGRGPFWEHKKILKVLLRSDSGDPKGAKGQNWLAEHHRRRGIFKVATQ